MLAMKKEKYFIDLSKLSEEQIKELAFVMKRTKKLHEKAFDYMSKGKTFDHFICLAQTDSKEWTLWNQNALFNRTELTCPEFIKLFEGGEGENNGWIKIESEDDLPKEGMINYFICVDTKPSIHPVNLRLLLSLYNDGMVSHYQKIQLPEPPKF